MNFKGHNFLYEFIDVNVLTLHTRDVRMKEGFSILDPYWYRYVPRYQSLQQTYVCIKGLA